MFQESFNKVFLPFCCSMNLIAATRAEGGLVFILWPQSIDYKWQMSLQYYFNILLQTHVLVAIILVWSIADACAICDPIKKILNEFFTLCTVFIKVISLIYEKIYFGDRVPLSGIGHVLKYVCIKFKDLYESIWR